MACLVGIRDTDFLNSISSKLALVIKSGKVTLGYVSFFCAVASHLGGKMANVGCRKPPSRASEAARPSLSSSPRTLPLCESLFSSTMPWYVPSPI